MRVRNFYMISMIGSLLFGVIPAVSAQTITVANIGTTYTANQETPVTQTITLKNKTKILGDYFLTFDPVPASRLVSRTGSTLIYSIYKGTTSASDELLNYANVDGFEDVLYGNFAIRNDTRVHTCYLIVAPAGFVTAGNYTGTVTVNWYGGVVNPKGTTLEVTDGFTFTVTVNTIISMCIVGVGQGFNPDAQNASFNFGTLTDDESPMSADLVVRTNCNYSLSVSSANNNVLYHKQGDTSSTIPYTLNIAGTDYTNLTTTPFQFKTGTTTGINGFAYTMTVTTHLSPPNYPTWGDYEDTLTFTIAAI